MPIPPIKRNQRRTTGAKIQLILSTPRCCRQNKTTNIIMAATRTISVQEKIEYTVRAKSPKLVEHWKIRRRGNRLAIGTSASGYLSSEQGDTTAHLRMAQLDSLNSRQNCKRWYYQHLLKRILANKSKKTGIKSWKPEMAGVRIPSPITMQVPTRTIPSGNVFSRCAWISIHHTKALECKLKEK